MTDDKIFLLVDNEFLIKLDILIVLPVSSVLRCSGETLSLWLVVDTMVEYSEMSVAAGVLSLDMIKFEPCWRSSPMINGLESVGKGVSTGVLSELETGHVS